MSFTRRKFIDCTCRSIAVLGAASALRKFGLMNAYAQTVNDYKALVCIFLFGGNDGNNTIIPLNPNGTTVSDYTATRGGLALSNPLPITLAHSQAAYANNFGLHPSMLDIQALFGQNRIALVANVGSLIQPTTKTQYQSSSFPKPSNLFSHSDQQNEGQTAGSNSLGTFGWGGRMADVLQPVYGSSQYPMVVSVSGASVFGTGKQTTQVTVIPPANTGPVSGQSCLSIANANCGNRDSAQQQLLTFDSGVSLVQAASGVTSKAFQYTTILNTARAGQPPLQSLFPANNGLSTQLREVAEIIAVHQTLGVGRQIFFVSLGGFDTHTNQLATQASLLTQVSQGMNAFYSALTLAGYQDKVVTFTLSDFARTLQPNTGGGTDHAWGNHNIVMGGVVKGGDMYGQYPALQFQSAQDVGANGRWIPTTSIDQYGATLASWFGVSAADLPYVFPHIQNFPNQQSLGFL